MSRIEPVKPATKFRKPFRTKRNSSIAAVVIVVISVLAINIAIKQLSGAHDYLVAAAAATEGTPLNRLPTKTVSLNLGDAGGDYLAAGAKLDGLELSQPLAVGDLLMRRDLEATDPNQQMAHLAITTKNALPIKLESGTRVDLWAAINDGGGQFGEPEVIAQNVQVFATSGGAGLFGDGANKIEIAVHQDLVKPILAAVLHADAISVVAIDGVG